MTIHSAFDADTMARELSQRIATGDAAKRALSDLHARITRVLQLHEPHESTTQPGITWCVRCGERYPCLTRNLLTDWRTDG